MSWLEITRLSPAAVLLSAAFLLFGAHCSGGELVLSGENLVWNPAIEPLSPQYKFRVVEGGPQGTADPVITWQLELRIEPTPGSIGSVQFNSLTLPPLPADHLFGIQSLGLMPVLVGPTSHVPVVGDADAFFTGVSVPAAGQNLMLADFAASPDALGLFEIIVEPLKPLFAGSLWLSPSGPLPIAFAGLAEGNEPVVIGSIEVQGAQVAAVPEPTGLMSIVLFTCVIVLRWRRRRRIIGSAA